MKFSKILEKNSTLSGGQFSYYGWDFYKFYISNEESEIHERVNPLEKVFPKVTKCTFKRFGPTASIETNDALCTLPLNILNEKIFVVLWWVYVSLAFLLVCGAIFRFLMYIPCVRCAYYSFDLNVKLETIRCLEQRKYLLSLIILSN